MFTITIIFSLLLSFGRTLSNLRVSKCYNLIKSFTDISTSSTTTVQVAKDFETAIKKKLGITGGSDESLVEIYELSALISNNIAHSSVYFYLLNTTRVDYDLRVERVISSITKAVEDELVLNCTNTLKDGFFNVYGIQIRDQQSKVNSIIFNVSTIIGNMLMTFTDTAKATKAKIKDDKCGKILLLFNERLIGSISERLAAFPDYTVLNENEKLLIFCFGVNRFINSLIDPSEDTVEQVVKYILLLSQLIRLNTTPGNNVAIQIDSLITDPKQILRLIEANLSISINDLSTKFFPVEDSQKLLDPMLLLTSWSIRVKSYSSADLKASLINEQTQILKLLLLYKKIKYKGAGMLIEDEKLIFNLLNHYWVMFSELNLANQLELLDFLESMLENFSKKTFTGASNKMSNDLKIVFSRFMQKAIIAHDSMILLQQRYSIYRYAKIQSVQDQARKSNLEILLKPLMDPSLIDVHPSHIDIFLDSYFSFIELSPIASLSLTSQLLYISELASSASSFALSRSPQSTTGYCNNYALAARAFLGLDGKMIADEEVKKRLLLELSANLEKAEDRADYEILTYYQVQDLAAGVGAN